MDPDQRAIIKNLLDEKLNLPTNSDFSFDPHIGETNIGPDIRIDSNNRTWFVEITHKASWDSLSHLLLYRELDRRDAILVLAARIIPATIKDRGNFLNILLVQLPPESLPEKNRSRVHGKFTSQKAWTVISGLLREGDRSIRNLSNSENVSYAWTHKVVNDLIGRGFAERKGNSVFISDLTGLYNAIAWERPFKDLEIGSIVTDFDSAFELARTLSESEYGKELVFCGYLAASLHFGIGIRSDLVQCYTLDQDILSQLGKDYSNKNNSGVELIICKPDRDVVKGSQRMKDVIVTSREQTILDIAGLGYQGRDLLIKMVKAYGSDR